MSHLHKRPFFFLKELKIEAGVFNFIDIYVFKKRKEKQPRLTFWIPIEMEEASPQPLPHPGEITKLSSEEHIMHSLFCGFSTLHILKYYAIVVHTNSTVL